MRKGLETVDSAGGSETQTPDGSIDTFTDQESWMHMRGTEPVAQIPHGCGPPKFPSSNADQHR